MAVPQLTSQDVGAPARTKINAAVDLLNAHAITIGLLVDLSPQVAELLGDFASLQQSVVAGDERADLADASTAALQDLMRALQSALDDEAFDRLALAQRMTTTEARRTEYTRAAGRPGQDPNRYAALGSVAGLGAVDATLPEVVPSTIVTGDAGAVVRMVGSGILAGRGAVPIEPGRIYRARAVLQRRANPSDPANDAVRFVLAWLDQSHTLLPSGDATTVLQQWDHLVVGDGRQEFVSLFSRSPGASVQVQAPIRARYARVAAICYGPDGGTDIEVLSIEDVTTATVLDPVSADIAARIGAQESIGTGPRLSAIESRLQTPNSLTFATKSDAGSATIPETVTTVDLRGAVSAGDGAGGLYRRNSGSPPPGADTFTSGGVTWVRVTPAAAVFNGMMDALFAGWFASLPVYTGDGPVPVAVGQPFNNGGTLDFARAS